MCLPFWRQSYRVLSKVDYKIAFNIFKTSAKTSLLKSLLVDLSTNQFLYILNDQYSFCSLIKTYVKIVLLSVITV